MKKLPFLLVATLAALAAPAFAQTNLSQGLTSTASSFQTGNEPGDANDGSTSTRWAAANGSFPQWWHVNLGASKAVSRVDIAWLSSASRAYKYKIETSPDDVTYTTVVDKTGNTTFGDTSDRFTATTRHVRVTVTGSTGGFASAYEIKVFGAAAPNIRIVAANAKVQSRKRGVAMNALSAADFQALAPGVSWFYNWGANPGSNVPPAGTSMTFYPMQWTNNSTAALSSYLASANPKPPVILGINEPNLKGQAFINPQATAAAIAQIKTVADQYGVSYVAPSMAAGSAAADSITAYDPIQNATVTYTSADPFLAATFYYTNRAGTPVPALAFHDYGNIGELKYFVQHLWDTYHKPVWMTEYAWWGAPDTTAARDFLIQATDYLERTPFVAGYAWFKERDNYANISLLNPAQSGALTPLGTNYVALPPHDTDLYYRLPGRLPAENYVTLVSGDLRATTDTDGTFDLTLSGTPSVDYNVQVDTARNYTVKFRATGAGTLTLAKGGTTLGTATTTSSGWQTVTITVPLTVGAQTLRVTRTGSVSALNWIEFQ